MVLHNGVDMPDRLTIVLYTPDDVTDSCSTEFESRDQKRIRLVIGTVETTAYLQRSVLLKWWLPKPCDSC